MKNKFSLCTMAVGILLAGCVTGKCGLTLGTVGPAPDAIFPADSPQGTLKVYSAFDVNADFNSRDPYRAEYTNYRIYSADGKLLQRVQNDNGSNFDSPANVTLAPGHYHVVAHANGYGTVTVPVVVTAGHSTTVHLEGGGVDDTAYNQNHTVRLPDGVVVGLQAQ